MLKSNNTCEIRAIIALFLLAFLFSDVNFLGFSQSENMNQRIQGLLPLSQLTTQKSLRELADENNLHIGAAVSQWETWDPLFLSTMRREFNTMSPTWEAFWTQIHPEPNRYDFDELDNLVEIAERYNMSLNYRRDIVWLLGYPAYLAHDDPAGSINQKSDLTRDELLSYLNDHIETVFGRYKGKFESIYVVNEPLETRYNETTWEPLPTEMRHSFWYDNIGPDYIEYAFNKTHEVDPDAKLFINEGLWWGVNPAIAADRRDQICDGQNNREAHSRGQYRHNSELKVVIPVEDYQISDQFGDLAFLLFFLDSTQRTL
jgi:GH35 family endo-1,4-beta-xylanase